MASNDESESDTNIQLISDSELDSLNRIILYAVTKQYKAAEITSFRIGKNVRIHLKKSSDPSIKGKIQLLSINSLRGNDESELDFFLSKIATQVVAGSNVGSLKQSQLISFYKKNGIDFIVPFVNGGNGSRGFTARFDYAKLKEALEIIYLYSTKGNIDTSVLTTIMNSQNVDFDYRRDILSDTLRRLENGIIANFTPNQAQRKNLSPDTLATIFARTISRTPLSNFFIVGDFKSADSLLMLLGRYLGTINNFNMDNTSVNEANKNWSDNSDTKTVELINLNKNVILSRVHLSMISEWKFSPASKAMLELIKTWLSIRIKERLRNKEMGVYSVLFWTELSPDANAIKFCVQFACSPGDEERLIEAVKDEIEIFKREKLDSRTVDNLRKGRLDNLTADLRSASFWLEYMQQQTIKNPKKPDFDEVFEELKATHDISADDLNIFVKEHFDTRKMNKYILYPAKD